MPFRTGGGGGGFTGDTNMATFIDQVVEPFLTDSKALGGLGWIQQTPSRGKGTTPDFEFLFSRGSVGSEAPPYLFLQTAAKTLWAMTGDGVDTSQEAYDQPNNPMNYPGFRGQTPTDPGPGDPATNYGTQNFACMGLSTVVGAYDNYWLFGGPTGEYCHIVIKVGAREYRHFHTGLLSPLHPDFPANAHYLTAHRWSGLAPDSPRINSDPPVSQEHQPYYVGHTCPFRNHHNNNTVGNFGDIRSSGLIVHVPGGYGSENYNWWLATGEDITSSGGGGSPASISGRAKNAAGNFAGDAAITKTIGTINSTDDAVAIGCMHSGYHDNSLGTVAFAAEPTFTTDGVSLIPINLSLHSDFQTDLRYGPVAQIPDVYRVNMKTLDAEQEILVGSETYVVFPVINKDSGNTVAGEGYSGYEGLAYRKITAIAT